MKPSVILFWKVVTISGTFGSWLVLILIFQMLQVFNLNWISQPSLFFKSMWPVLWAWAASQGLKKVFKRKRPWQADPNRPALVRSPQDDSFPSSHAATSFAFAISLFLANHPLWGVVLVWSVLVTLSRYLLRVHYVTDLLAGLFVAVIVNWVIFKTKGL